MPDKKTALTNFAIFGPFPRTGKSLC